MKVWTDEDNEVGKGKTRTEAPTEGQRRKRSRSKADRMKTRLRDELSNRGERMEETRRGASTAGEAQGQKQKLEGH